MDNLTPEEIKKSSEIAVENARPIVTGLVVKDPLLRRALKALDIKPINKPVKKGVKRGKKSK